MRRRIVLWPQSFRGRLVLAFSLVVAIALALVLASLPRLLDGYFAQQEERNLQTRSGVVAALAVQLLLQSQYAGPDAPNPIVIPTDPPTVSERIREAFGTSSRGYIKERLTPVAQADIEIVITPSPDEPNNEVFRLNVPVDPAVARELQGAGQQRENLSRETSYRVRDVFWSQLPAGGPERLVRVRLYDPFTFRAQTLNTIILIMSAAAALAMAVAVIASILLADRLTNPVRRLTGAARALERGKLETRVSLPDSSSPEVGELATAFNRMAARLEESIEFIRSDRDRSRDFLADVSHELRTPIAALRTFNELLQDGADVEPATRQEFLEQSRLQIERLDWLAQNLLELSKLESGLVALDLRPDDLRATVESAVQQAEPGARRRRVELVMDIPERAVRQRHDPQRLGQVLSNLIGNAVKFTPPGGQVTVRLQPTDGGADLHVSDTGVGIDPRELPHVFERFYRGTHAHEARAGGSGLGLSIVKSIVEMHGGRVSIESAPGAGTDVTVQLPRELTLSSPVPTPA
jgi:signal transduction histidine kinase